MRPPVRLRLKQIEDRRRAVQESDLLAAKQLALAL